MATNDGYSPYPIGLTAVESVSAINRAFNLDEELRGNTNGYGKYYDSSTAPSIATNNIKSGDVWRNSTTSKLYMANVETGILVWIEV